MTNNPIVHWEILGPDGEAQRSFYSTIFDWNLAAVDGFPNYFTVEDHGIGVGGAVGRGMDEMPAYACIYVRVEDIDQTLAAVNLRWRRSWCRAGLEGIDEGPCRPGCGGSRR